MSQIVKVKIEGLEEVAARLQKLADNIQKRMLVTVMKAALIPTLTAAQSRTPTGPAIVRSNRKQGGAKYSNIPGRLRRSYRIKKMRSSNRFLLEVQLQNTAYYARWVEYGHKVARGPKGGPFRTVGHTRPQPFMRDTYESEKEAVIKRVAALINAGLTRRGV